MNFLRRTSKIPSFSRRQSVPNHPSPESQSYEERKEEDGVGSDGESEDVRKHMFSMGGHNHSDVSDREGWILIPKQGLPEDWSDAVDMEDFLSLDRSFVFPGEQLHILACLAAFKQDIDITSSSRTSEEIPMNSRSLEINKEKMTSGNTKTSSICGIVDIDSEHHDVYSEMSTNKAKINTKEDFSTAESLVQLEEHKNQTEWLLDRFKNSHFFVRISESGEPLWSKRSKEEASDDGSSKSSREIFANTNIDSGTFNTCASGGLARNAARCYSLCNGDIVVLLQVNVGIDNIKDPVLEVLQFVKSKISHLSSQYSQALTAHYDPNRELLRWIFPMDSALPPPPPPPVSPKSPSIGFVPDAGSVYLRSTPSSSSQLFSFGNFKTYSMPSLPPASSPSTTSHPRPSFDLEDFDKLSLEKLIKNQDLKMKMPLSFRGVFLEPEKFSVQCGLGAAYLPGRRWRKKLEIIQPIEMHSFAADCNTENLLCVQIKNVCPSHIPEMIIYLDAINIIFEEAPKSGPPLSLPLSCIEAGSGHSLPNLALREGEEHSFILKPTTLQGRRSKVFCSKNHHHSNIKAGAAVSNRPTIPNNLSNGNTVLNLTNYAVLVSYKCNYTESILFLKKPTSWRPHDARDLMISVASEMSEQIDEPERTSQLPFQVLTLRTSNLTSEDLTLTVLAPTSFTTTPSAVPLNSVPRTPVAPLTGFSESVERVSKRSEGGLTTNDSMPLPGAKKEIINLGMRSFSVDEDVTQRSIPNSDSNCTHLWLQSTVSLGCVPAQSSVTVKLQSLPLTDGIITLDTLQVLIKEKGVTYVPEHPLKIYATSSIAIGI